MFGSLPPPPEMQTTKLVVWGKLPMCLVVYPPPPTNANYQIGSLPQTTNLVVYPKLPIW